MHDRPHFLRQARVGQAAPVPPGARKSSARVTRCSGARPRPMITIHRQAEKRQEQHERATACAGQRRPPRAGCGWKAAARAARRCRRRSRCTRATSPRAVIFSAGEAEFRVRRERHTRMRVVHQHAVAVPDLDHDALVAAAARGEHGRKRLWMRQRGRDLPQLVVEEFVGFAQAPAGR